MFRCLSVCACLLLLPSLCAAQPIKAGMSPGQYVVGNQVLTVNPDGTGNLAVSPDVKIAQLGVTPAPPTPTPGPGPSPVPVLNARAQAVLDAVKAITDPDKAKDAAGFAKVLTETKAMLVANNVGDASIIGMTLQFAMSKTVAAIPAGTAWKPVTELIGKQFTEQQKTNSDAVLGVLDDAIAGLSAAAPGVSIELPFVVDPKAGKAKTGDDGKEIANPKYTPSMAAAPGAFDWIALLTQLLPMILAILQMFMSAVQYALPFIALLA